MEGKHKTLRNGVAMPSSVLAEKGISIPQERLLPKGENARPGPCLTHKEFGRNGHPLGAETRSPTTSKLTASHSQTGLPAAMVRIQKGFCAHAWCFRGKSVERENENLPENKYVITIITTMFLSQEVWGNSRAFGFSSACLSWTRLPCVLTDRSLHRPG